MIFFASLAAALGATLWLVSYIAKMLLAKRPGMGWILLAWITGSVLAAIAIIPLSLFGGDIDPQIMFIATLVLSFIISSAAYKYINQMGWGGAFTTNIASSVIALVAVVMAVVLSGNSLKDTFNSVNMAAQKNISLSDGFANTDQSSNFENGSEVAHDTDTDEAEDVASVDNDLEPVFNEIDLLPKGAIKELQAKKKPYVSPKYHVVQIGSINSLVGRSIRIRKSNGRVVAGSLQKIRGNNAVVKQRIHGGEAVIPVSIATIRKLEVHR